MLFINTTKFGLSESYCTTTGLNVIRHPLIRFSQMCAFLTCALAIILLFRMLLKKLPKLSYHRNFKLILWAFHFNALIHAVVMTFSQIHQFFRGFFINEPCDIFLDSMYYRSANITIILVMQLQIWMLFGLWAERFIATIYQKKYEKNMQCFGLILLILTSIVPICLTFWAYFEEEWQDPALNVINTPPSSGTRVNIVLYIHLGICCFSLILIISINQINQRLKLFKNHSSLSSQYQISENVITTRILMYVSIFTTTMYILYILCTLSVRLSHNAVFFRDRYPLYQGLRNAAYILPLFDLILPLITQFVHDHGRRTANIKRLEVLSTPATGEEGWKMYSSIIQKQWG